MDATEHIPSVNVAYLANFQGDDVVLARRLMRNRALAGSHKIATLAELLAGAGCAITVFSLGAAAECSMRFYPAFQGSIPGVHDIPVSYQTEWDIPVIGRIVGVLGLVRSVLMANRSVPIDLVLLYNCGLAEVFATRVLCAVARVPVVLEYEDDVSHGPDGRRSWRQYCHSLGLFIVKRHIKGLIAVSPELRNRFELSNSYILRGVLSEDLANIRPVQEPIAVTRFLFAGSLQASKGVDTLCTAFGKANLSESELHITGEGPMLDALRATFRDDPRIRFHGFVQRSRLIELFEQAHILVNPHRVAGEIGAVFPFKMIEYIGTGRPVISTQMAPLRGPIAAGVCYSQTDSAEELSNAMKSVCANYTEWLERAKISRDAAWRSYNPRTVSDRIVGILRRAVRNQAAS